VETKTPSGRGPWPWLLGAGALLLAAVALWLWPLAERGPQIELRPVGGAAEVEALSEDPDLNVLFILIDTLRSDRLHTYGYERPTSPFLDIVASEGVRFARNLAQSSWTKCSMASMWTGLYPARAGVTRFDHVLADKAKLPAEIFREAGFRTVGIWRNGWVEGYHGFSQGFDVYTRPGVRVPPVEVRRENPTVHHGGTDADVVEEATEFLRSAGKQRWFLYLHLMDLHEYTYTLESAKFGTASSDIYDNAILHTDQVLDQLFGRLATRGVLDNTLVIISSDHGEAHGERGHEGHARNVYPENTEVPWILVFPFRLQPGVVVSQRTANVDVWPTVLDLLGLAGLEDADGESRVPEILAAVRRQPMPQRETLAISHLDQTWGQRVDTTAPNLALTDGRYRYVQFRSAKGDTREELFDAQRDDRELEDRLEAEPEVAQQMRDAAESYLASPGVWAGEVDDLELDEMELNQLRALGYAIP